jgi:hypothetical protein
MPTKLEKPKMSNLSADEKDFVFGLVYDAWKRADDPEWVESVMVKLAEIITNADDDTAS